MSGFLFGEIIFGPVRSRRFGVSLGINLLPLDSKLCSFDCIYCECGLTGHEPGTKPQLYTAAQIHQALENKFREMKSAGQAPDSITFAGNGEPTLHPEFTEVMKGVAELRNSFFPKAKVTVLSNASLLDRENLKAALLLADNNVLKLDAGTEEMFRAINRPLNKVALSDIVKRLTEFAGELVIQTLFLRGTVDGKRVDNTVPSEVDAWLEHLKIIRPKLVMIYPIDRIPPFSTLEKINHDELVAIAGKVESIGLTAEVF